MPRNLKRLARMQKMKGRRTQAEDAADGESDDDAEVGIVKASRSVPVSEPAPSAVVSKPTPSMPSSSSAVGGGTSNPEVYKRIEMNATSTAACIFLLLSIGASIASSYILIHNPGCMGESLAGPSPSAAAVVAAAPTTSATVGTVTTSAVAGGGAVGSDGMPPKCSIDQSKEIKKQLPSEYCFGQPFNQQCSFCRATNRGTCRDNSWFREIYSQKKLDQFNAVFINRGGYRDAEIMDVMAVGSHDAAKFNSVKFVGGAAQDCKKPVTMGDPQPAFGLAISDDTNQVNSFLSGKSSAGLMDSDLKGVVATLSAQNDATGKTLDTIMEEQGMKDKPIHIMRMKGNDYDVLKGATETLKQVRNIEFEYHWESSWGRGSLRDIIRLMTSNQMVCYWYGLDGNLWRISDCWQMHYAQKWWSQITCVSAVHEDSKPVLAKMEEAFDATLKKDQTFGGP